MRSIRTLFAALALAGITGGTAAFATSAPPKPVVKVSSTFSGAKVNAGNVTMTMEGGKIMLTLSDDVPDPKTPDPHWLVIDRKGQTYLLDRLMIKDDKLNKTITLPAYIKDVAKVQVFCAWAVANLGEASF
ncbi:MAG: hypothetical protein AB7L66_05025 [Gemmatimonadales bacterium]